VTALRSQAAVNGDATDGKIPVSANADDELTEATQGTVDTLDLA